MNEVVITGIGFITPCGDTVAGIRDALARRVSAISALSGADYSTMPVSHGGRVDPGIVAGYRLDPIKLKGFNDYVRFGLIAAANALADAGFIRDGARHDYGPYAEDRRGAFVSSGVNGRNAEALFEAFSMSAGADGRLDLSRFASEGISAVHPKWILTAISNNLIFFLTSEYALRGDNNNAAYSAAGGFYMLDAAIGSISSGRSDMAIVAGADSILNWQAIDDLSKLGLLSTKGAEARRMEAFTARATGALPSEGAACLVLERRDMAEKRGAGIYCRAGSVIERRRSSEAFGPPAGGEPAGEVLSGLLERAPEKGSILVNLNAAAAPGWDRAELAGVTLALGSTAHNVSERVVLTASKPYFGHAFSASFVIDAAVSAMSVRNSEAFAMPHDAEMMKERFCGEHGSLDISAAITLGQCFGGNTGGAIFEKL